MLRYFLLFIGFFINQACHGAIDFSVDRYRYDVNIEINVSDDHEFRAINHRYDVVPNLRYGREKLSNFNLQKEAREGSFFAFEAGFVATKGAGWFDDIARSATRNPDSSRLVLGHFATQGTSYQKVAAHYNATYFKVENWAAVTKGLSQGQIWKINETFLTQQLRQGKQVLFSHNPLKAKSGSFFEREVNFMRELGYSFRQKNQWTWEAVR